MTKPSLFLCQLPIIPDMFYTVISWFVVASTICTAYTVCSVFKSVILHLFGFVFLSVVCVQPSLFSTKSIHFKHSLYSMSIELCWPSAICLVNIKNKQCTWHSFYIHNRDTISTIYCHTHV